ncbi:MAG: 4-diphosphocytidyl-2-C-methyl-D-erythritol kinase [Acidobacteriota bacterium]|nr:4-diphosphocytidyl-2-C-methyl-D-erythritol kinase [Acidobacteriota bacterium]
MRFLSFAKVNLHLEVLRRRGDGFHDLRTIFQTIDLADEIELSLEPLGRAPSAVVGLAVEGAQGLPADESNLAWRAAARFLAAWGRPGEGVRLRLKKRIPIGGGLGGGSANAATVLLGLSALLERHPGPLPLAEMAAELGSDVPFFLQGGTALGTGRGEQLEWLPDPAASPLDLWLAVPPVVVATSAVFSAHRVVAASGEGATPVGEGESEPVASARRALAATGESAAVPAAWSPLLGWNDLEPTCLALYPAVRDVYNRLSESGAVAVRLSGSGSTIFALFADREAGEAVGARLGSETVWLPVQTLSRTEWRRRTGLFAQSGGS